MKKVLIVEDDFISRDLLMGLLKNHFDTCHMAVNGREAVDAYARSLKEQIPYSLICLDIMMPIMDGYTTLQKIREEDKKIPILVLSAKDAIKDKVKCLSIGVDDYLSKPFSLEEFLLRIDRLLLRASWGQEGDLKPKNIPDEIVFGNNRVDFKTKKGFINGDEVNLTLQELNLLQVFAQNIGLPLSRSELLEQGWGYSQDTSTRTVDNFIVRFRKYFEKNPKKPIHFKSVRSIGYVFNKN